MPVTLQYELAAGDLRFIEVDVSTRQGHAMRSEVTEHPVELGASITDHIRPQNDELAFTGFVTNAPIVVPKTNMEGVGGRVRPLELKEGQGAATLQFDDRFDRVRSVFEELLEVKEKGALFTVYTPLHEYENMALVSVDVVQDVATGDAMELSFTFKGIVFVETQLVALPEPAEPRGRGQDDRGQQSAEETTEDADGPRNGVLAELFGTGAVAR